MEKLLDTSFSGVQISSSVFIHFLPFCKMSVWRKAMTIIFLKSLFIGTDIRQSKCEQIPFCVYMKIILVNNVMFSRGVFAWIRGKFASKKHIFLLFCIFTEMPAEDWRSPHFKVIRGIKEVCYRLRIITVNFLGLS